MTEFLTLNGWGVPIAEGGAKRSGRQFVGPAASRSNRGSMRRGERAHAWTDSFTTPVIDADTADALVGLLAGEFYHWPFDDVGLYSEGGGLGPVAVGYNAALYTTSPTPKFGTRYVRVSTSGGSIPWSVDLNSASTWTFMFWHNYNNTSPGANSWTHYAIVNNAGSYSVYSNGALSYGPSGTPPTNPGNFSVSVSGLVGTFSLLGKQVNGTNTANANFDDVVVALWAMPAAQVAAYYESGQPWSPEPFLDAGGAYFNAGTTLVEVDPAVGDVETRQAVYGGAWNQDLRVVNFTLSPRAAV